MSLQAKEYTIEKMAIRHTEIIIKLKKKKKEWLKIKLAMKKETTVKL